MATFEREEAPELSNTTRSEFTFMLTGILMVREEESDAMML
jgi:hypothetical protein